MKKLFSVLLSAVFGVSLYAATLDIVAVSDKIYKVGEPVTFNVTGWESKDKKLAAGIVTLTVRDSGGKVVGNPVNIDFSQNNPATMCAKLDRPGFILVTASDCRMPDKKVIQWNRTLQLPLGGAAVEPEKIKSGAECPADFNQFWADGVKAYAQAEVIVKEDPALNNLIAGHKNVSERFKDYKVSRIIVKFPDGSGAVDGFLAVPVKPGKYPIIAGVPGAGAGTIYPGTPYVSRQPAIQLFMNVHKYPTAVTLAEQTKRYNEYNSSFDTPDGVLKLYITYKADDRNEYIFRKVWLSLNRALEYVMTLKEFDGKNVAAVGSSQGGGTALALAGLNSRVSCVVANIPALCDHSGWKVGRAPGWPHLHSNCKGKADSASPYFDAAYFALNIKVPAFVSVGYVDTTCSPSSVYAAFNNLQGSKTIYPMPRRGHADTAAFRTAANKFLTEQFSK